MAWAASKYLHDNGAEVLEGYSQSQAWVFVRLAYHVNEHEFDHGKPNPNYGWAWPSTATIAKMPPPISENTVRLARRLGVDRGLIFTDGKSYRNTLRYRFPAVHPFNSSEGVDVARPLQMETLTPSTFRSTPSNGDPDPFRAVEPEVIEVVEVEKETRASARPSQGKKTDKREPWQVAKDAEEAERMRVRTPEELAVIAKRQRQRDEDDAAHTARLEQELAEADDPALGHEWLRKAGLTTSSPTTPTPQPKGALSTDGTFDG